MSPFGPTSATHHLANDRSEHEDASCHGAALPCQSDTSILMPRGPKEIKEECGAKDEGHEDAGEDVVRSHTDVVVVVLDSG